MADRLLAVMQDFMHDKDSLEKGMKVMQAVNYFDAHTQLPYEQAKAAAAGDPALRAAIEAFRADQATFARRVMNGDESEWGSMHARHRELGNQVVAAARATPGG